MATKDSGISTTKLLLLYLLNAVDSRLSELQILRIVSENNWVSYFDLQENIFELVQGDMLEAKQNINGKFYTITELGKDTLHFFQKELRASLRQEIDTYAQQNREQLRLETQLYAEYIRISDGEYRVTLKILERDVPVLDLNIVCYSKREAQAIAANWQSRATAIYKDLLIALLQN